MHAQPFSLLLHHQEARIMSSLQVGKGQAPGGGEWQACRGEGRACGGPKR